MRRVYLIELDERGNLKNVKGDFLVVTKLAQKAIAQGIIKWAKEVTEGCVVRCSSEISLYEA